MDMQLWALLFEQERQQKEESRVTRESSPAQISNKKDRAGNDTPAQEVNQDVSIPY